MNPIEYDPDTDRQLWAWCLDTRSSVPTRLELVLGQGPSQLGCTVRYDLQMDCFLDGEGTGKIPDEHREPYAELIRKLAKRIERAELIEQMCEAQGLIEKPGIATVTPDGSPLQDIGWIQSLTRIVDGWSVCVQTDAARWNRPIPIVQVYVEARSMGSFYCLRGSGDLRSFGDPSEEAFWTSCAELGVLVRRTEEQWLSEISVISRELADRLNLETDPRPVATPTPWPSP